MASFQDLQIGFFNELLMGLGFAQGTPLQLLQPSVPLVSSASGTTAASDSSAHDDKKLWDYLNMIPPATLMAESTLSGGASFFDNYSAMVSALQAPENDFATDVGSDCSNQWDTYLEGLPDDQFPSLDMLPRKFQRWAVAHGFISVADIGASDLASVVLDPISAAKISAAAFKGKGPSWDQGYLDLKASLKQAPSRTFTLDSKTMNTSSANVWSHSGHSGFFGLFSSSSDSSQETDTFANSEIKLDASFDHVTQFSPVPNAWYNSGAMADAYSHKTGLPWNAGTIDWSNTFDPDNGSLARFATSLLVVQGMKITLVSSANYSSNEQSSITTNSPNGMWPFYSSDSNSGTITKTTFGTNNDMTVTITSDADTPILLGLTVLPVSKFVGHAVEGAKLHARAMHQWKMRRAA